MRKIRCEFSADKGRAISEAPLSPPLKDLTPAQLGLFSYGDNRPSPAYLNSPAWYMDQLLNGRSLETLSDLECSEIRDAIIEKWYEMNKDWWPMVLQGLGVAPPTGRRIP